MEYIFLTTCLYFQTNTFQCVLASSRAESYIIFLYKELQWTTGDVSDGGRGGLGGTEALVGINAGDRINSITVPGSRSPNITNVANTSNVNVSGVWMFKIDECTYVCMYLCKIM